MGRSHPGRLTLVAGALLAAACATSPDRRTAGLREALEGASTEAGMDAVRDAAAKLPAADVDLASAPCELCVEAVACEGATCGIWLRRLAVPVVLLAREEGSRTSIRVHRGSRRYGTVALLALWRALDPPTAEAALAQAGVADPATGPIRAWDALGFEPRWSGTFQVVLSGGSRPLYGAGLRFGAHHWHTPLVLTSYLLELDINFREIGDDVRGGATIALPVRVGLSHWTPEVELRDGRPGTAIYLHAAPVLEFGLGAPLGWRAGVGLSFGPIPSRPPGSGFLEVYVARMGEEPFFGFLLGGGT